MSIARHGAADGHLSLAVSGELDMASSAMLAEAVRDAVADQPTRLTIDMSRVTFVDSSGLRVLVLGRELALERTVAFQNDSPQKGVRRVLEVTGVLSYLSENA